MDREKKQWTQEERSKEIQFRQDHESEAIHQLAPEEVQVCHAMSVMPSDYLLYTPKRKP